MKHLLSALAVLLAILAGLALAAPDASAQGLASSPMIGGRMITTIFQDNSVLHVQCAQGQIVAAGVPPPPAAPRGIELRCAER